VIKGNKPEPITFKRQEHLSLVDIAYNALVEAIINQEYGPGAPISIDGLAKQLEMSNTPIREALMRAKGERLVKQKTNYGFVVSDLLTPKELHDMFEVRHLLEIHALRSAVITDKALEQLTQFMEQMRTAKDGSAYDDYKNFLQLDHAFHYALVSLAENALLVKSWQDLHVHLHLSRLYLGVGLFDRQLAQQEHESIFEALRKHDNQEAADRLSRHILRVEHGLEDVLKR
jgi:DNA-binding GntR family transcriptional regulator